MISSPGSVASITKRQLAPGRIGQPFVEPKASIHLSTWNGRSLQRKNYSICILYQSCPCKSTIPGPSNRSPPATFKSPKATISETCRVGCWSLNPPTTLLCSSFGALRNPRRSHARRVHAFGLFTVSAGSTSHGPPRRDVTEGCAAPRRSLAQTVSACHTTPTSISILLTGACSTD